MFTLNLLPESYKKELRLEFFRRIFFIGSIFIVSAAFIFGITIFLGIQYLSIQNYALNERIAGAKYDGKAKQVQDMEEGIANLNKLLAQIVKVQGEQPHDLVAIIEKLIRLMPQGTSLKSLTLSASTDNLLIAGRAALRSQIITMQENLENEPMFAAVESPLSNLLEAQNADFKFTITIAE